jgi:hypothetical protein
MLLATTTLWLTLPLVRLVHMPRYACTAVHRAKLCTHVTWTCSVVKIQCGVVVCSAAEPFLLLAEHMGATFTAYPHVKQYVDRVKGRKAVAQVLQLHEEAGMHQQDVFGGVV